MVKVGFLFPQMMGIGGAERWLAGLLKGLSEHPVELVGVAVRGDIPVEDRQVVNTQRYCPVWVGAAGLDRVCAASDVLVTWGTQHVLNEWVGPHREKGLKVVLTAHSLKPMCCHSAHEEAADYLVAVSEAARAFFPAHAQFKVRVIHPGVEVDRVTPTRPREDLRRTLGYGPTDRVVGYLGRYSDEKNPLAVTMGVPTLGPGWHALMVGAGPLTGALCQSIDGLPYGRHQVMPAVERPGDALAAMDCLVVPSHYESYCLSAVEAWLAGVPLVMTPTGVRAEFEPRFGPLCSPIPFSPNPQELADAVQRAVHPAFMGIADKARRLAWGHLTASATGRVWAELLAEIGPRKR